MARRRPRKIGANARNAGPKEMTLSSKVLIVDYGTGNLNSIKRILDRSKIHSIISSQAKDVLSADKIILPGVGHFGKAMANLKQLDLVGALNEVVMIRRKPVLGVCLGMQLMALRSQEGDADGLGWLDAETVRFDISDRQRYKVPHVGWNQVSIKKNSSLMSGVQDLSEFYFAHSYYLRMNDPSDVLNETTYETTFTSAIEKDNIFGVQYHPEKSHDAGVRLITNFAAI